MLQNPRKTLGFKKNMVYKIPPGGGEVNHIQPVAYKRQKVATGKERVKRLLKRQQSFYLAVKIIKVQHINKCAKFHSFLILNSFPVTA